ncbi:MAG: hypothetical protein ACRDD1_04650, partial [Planctomycetia bacterium]
MKTLPTLNSEHSPVLKMPLRMEPLEERAVPALTAEFIKPFSSIGQPVEVGGLLFFRANDGSGTGVELWKSDGTAAGTVLVKDIFPGAA